MSNERLQILQMVAEGKVSAEEANKLLDALENGNRAPKGPKATHLRVQTTEGKKVTNFSVGIGLARWLLSLPLFMVSFGEERVDADQLISLIDSGVVGKVLEIGEGGNKLEIWLDP